MHLSIDNELEWLGQIPKNWNLVKFNTIYRNRNIKVSDREYAPLSVTKCGVVPQLGNAAKTNDNDNRKLVLSGDFVINSRSDRRGACGISSLNGSVSLINTVLSPRSKEIYPEYFDWLFHTNQFADEFYKWGHGIVDDLWTTNWNDMKNITLPLPPMNEQRFIANFLDKRCGEINKLSNKINDELKQLKSYQSSLITRTITKGIDSNVPMKKSGIEWIGTMPRKWKLIKIKYLVEIKNNKSRLKEMNNHYIGLENVQKGSGRYISCDNKYDDQLYSSCREGQVLYSKLRPNLAKVLIAPFDACCTSEFEVLQAKNIHNKWLKYSLLTDGITKLTTAATYGVKMPRVNWNFVANIKIPIPNNNDEADKIISNLEEKLSLINKLIKKKSEQIQLLEKLKKSLIYEYVTGKKILNEYDKCVNNAWTNK